MSSVGEVNLLTLTLKSNEKYTLKKHKLTSISVEEFEENLINYLNSKFKEFDDFSNASIFLLDKVTVSAEIKNQKQKFFSKKISKFEDSLDFILHKLRKIFFTKRTRQLAFEANTKLFKSKVKESFGKTILDIDIPKKLYQIPYSIYTPVDIVNINYASIRDLNYYKLHEAQHLKILKEALNEVEETKNYFVRNKIENYQKLILKNFSSKFYLNKRTMTVNPKVQFLFLDILFYLKIEDLF